ncbi:MAG: hypothetical protein DCC49_01085 [Acidobacteria bacterium]|nr:MAG: hypothetical protein DCC49_01085 [Acidobacteriota bacterium]
MPGEAVTENTPRQVDLSKLFKVPSYFARALVIMAATILVLAVTPLALLPLRGVGSVATYNPPWSVSEEIDLAPLAQNSYMYARDGALMATLHAEENRIPVGLTEVAPVAVKAYLAAEDASFYQHDGVNLRAIARALVVNVNRGSISQGGSTITQQVVKNSLLTTEQTVERKIKEVILARRLEESYTKDEILQRYMNTTYLGNGAYGVRAGAEVYYNKGAENLSLGEAALLAGLIRSPADADPILNPERSRERRSEVLAAMVYEGMIDQGARQAAEAEPIPDRTFHKEQIQFGPGDYFAEWVKQVLLKEDLIGETPTQRYNALFKGGLRIETTFDPKLQAFGERAVDTQGPHSSQFTAALASVDTKSGAVRVLVGGRNFKETKYNLATQSVRGTGSSFKIFTLVAAFSNGVSPNDAVDGTGPCNLKMPGGGTWKANNYGGEGGGVMSVRAATAKSVNCAFARMILKIGVDKVIDAARAMGLPEPIKTAPSITLGTQEESPVDMAAAFATLPRGGVRHRLYYVEKITGPKGETVYQHESPGEQTVDRCVALTTVDVMRGVVNGGTGGRASIGRQPVAGKTGTGEKYRDAWFVGFSPHLSTAVWVGNPEAEISMHNVNGFGSVAGGTIPSAVFSAFMRPAHDDLPVEDFERPNCKLKGGALKGGTAGDSTSAPSSDSGPSSDAPPAPAPSSAPPPDTTEPPVTSPPSSTTPPTSSTAPAPTPT